MPGCELGLGTTFDLGLCAHSLFLGWVPDWVWVIAPYWPWLFIIVGLGVAYRFAGWPGVVAVAGVLGYLKGRMDASKQDPIEHVDPASPDAAPSPPKPKTVRRTTGKRQGIPGFDHNTGTWEQ